MDLQQNQSPDLAARTPVKQYRFIDLKIGDSFDFVGPDPMLVTFHKRCVKVSDRTYRDIDGREHEVGTRAVPVFNVAAAVQETSHRDRIRSTGQIAVAWTEVAWPDKEVQDRLVWLSGGNNAIAFDPSTGIHWSKVRLEGGMGWRWSTCRI
jgi:hypothetical protein